MDRMTAISNAATAARESSRETTGQFGEQPHTAPEMTLAEVNETAMEISNRLATATKEYLAKAMPAEAHRVTFEWSDQGDYLTTSEVFDADGKQIDTYDDDEAFERYQEVSRVVSYWGGDNVEALVAKVDGVHTWTRTEPFDQAEADRVAAEHDALATQWHEIRELSEDTAAGSIDWAEIPEEVDTLVFEWSDQGDWLNLIGAKDADGEEVDLEELDPDLYEDLDDSASNIAHPASHGFTEPSRGVFHLTRTGANGPAVDSSRFSAEDAARQAELRATVDERHAAAARSAAQWNAEVTAHMAAAQNTSGEQK
jgi:hypothetical protein